MQGNACSKCKNFDETVADFETCRAFRDGIPYAIAMGGNDHQAPFAGDGGVRFEPMPGFEYLLRRRG